LSFDKFALKPTNPFDVFCFSRFLSIPLTNTLVERRLARFSKLIRIVNVRQFELKRFNFYKK